MNERIKELIEQATTQKQIVAGDEFQLAMSVEFFDKEKFAELIVEECCKSFQGYTFEEIAVKTLKATFRS